MRSWFLNRPLTVKLILIFAAPFLFLVLVCILTLMAFQEFEAAETMFERSDTIKSQGIYYLELLYSMQNAFRGYVLTGDAMFLPRYYEAKGDIDLAGFELARLVKDSPSPQQGERVSTIQVETRRLIEEADEIVARLLTGQTAAGIAYIKGGHGQKSGDRISAALSQFQLEADRIQTARSTAVERNRVIVLRVIIGGAVLTLLLTGLGVFLVARSVTKPMASLAAAAAEIGESVAVLFPDAERQDEVGALSRSMEEMQRRLVPAERLATLTRMATSIAHDLRTPLLGVEQGLQGLRYIADPQLNAEARALLEDLHTGSRLAVGIVQDILDLYRQAYGELPLSYSRFNIGEVAKEAVELMGAEIRDRRLSVSVEGQLPLIFADRRRLFRVLVNLLDNAIKNSPSGGHVWIVAAAHKEGAGMRAVVAVEDEGSGLDPAMLDQLFEPSKLVSRPTRGGTGLGLYLCRLVIAAHHGIILAENRPNGGARFTFDIPIERREVEDVHPAVDRRRPASV